MRGLVKGRWPPHHRGPKFRFFPSFRLVIALDHAFLPSLCRFSRGLVILLGIHGGLDYCKGCLVETL